MIFPLSTIFILFYFLAEGHGSCHTCQSNFAVCHDDRRFSMCTEGIPADKIHTCPNGYVCTAEIEICVQSSASNSVQPTCEAACGLCNSPEKLFACVDETTYVYCFGADVPDYSATGICPDGYVCNLGSREVCTPASQVYPSCYEGASNTPTTLSPSFPTDLTPNPSSTPINPPSATSTSIVTDSQSSSTVTTDPATNPGTTTTSPFIDTSSSTASPTTTTATQPTTTGNPTTSTTASTTTANPRDESEFCRNKQHGGLYKSYNDPTCQEFILCYILSGQYLGLRYICTGAQFFNEETKICQIERPVNC